MASNIPGNPQQNADLKRTVVRPTDDSVDRELSALTDQVDNQADHSAKPQATAADQVVIQVAARRSIIKDGKHYLPGDKVPVSRKDAEMHYASGHAVDPLLFKPEAPVQQHSDRPSVDQPNSAGVTRTETM
jgi:hypothetical protein